MVFDPNIRAGIFAGESGGDYNALFGYQNRPNGQFSNVQVSQMPVGDVIAFTDPSGPYAQYVRGQVGHVATPVGAYQVVGSTLRDAVNALGIDPSTRFDQQTQDRIGQWILENQGTGAWEGYQAGATPSQQPYTQVSTRGMDTQMPQPQQPRGLLEYFGVQKQGSGPQGDLPFYQRDRFRDMAGRIAVAANSLRQNPDQNIPAMAEMRRQERAANRTAEWLSQQPNSAEFVQMLQSGADPAQVLMAYRQSQQPAQADPTSGMRNYQFMISHGVDPQTAMERAFGAGGTTVNVGGGPEVGTIPQGYELYQDPESGAYQMRPIPGGPADTTANEAAAAEQTGRAAGVVLDDIDRLQRILDESTLPVTGAGSLLKSIPGSNAYDASQLIETIVANVGFDRLQQMREASPTGGALGAVSERELSTLQAVLGSLDQSQSQAQLEYNLSRLEELYVEIIRKASAYPNAAQFGFGGGSSGAASSDGFSITGTVGQ